MQKTLLVMALAAFVFGGGCGGGQEEGVDSGVPDLSGGVDGPGGTVSCNDYCAELMQHCTGGEAVDGGLADYPNLQSCLNVCAALPVGTFNMTTGDTVGCREYHGGVPASMDPVQHCPHASATGAGVCGADRCEAFCILVGVCPSLFSDKADCMAKCGTPPYQLAVEQPEMTRSGATLNCAFYYLTIAYENPAAGDGGTAAAACAQIDPNNSARACQ